MSTCMSSRVVHFEIIHSLTTSLFIKALQRVIGRGGNVRTVYSDNSSNFTGVDSDLHKAIQELDGKKIQDFLQFLACDRDWIILKRNPPAASHMCEVWKKLICSILTILSSLLKTHRSVLNDKLLLTLMTEAEEILNSRLLSVETISDPTNEMSLSPANILTIKSKVIMSTPGIFSKADLFLITEKDRNVSNIL